MIREYLEIAAIFLMCVFVASILAYIAVITWVKGESLYKDDWPREDDFSED